MKNKRRWGRLLLLSYLLSGAALAGERHALLIGVGALPAMPRSSWLAGPATDVAAMRDALRRQGFADEHIYRLADDAGASQAPTRAAILARLAQLEQSLGKDDVLLLYWSGHSVLLPVYPGQAAAPQGRRTRLLTRDSQVSHQGRQLDGGLDSSELGRAIDAFAARQTQVVAVFDTCHAAAGTRSGDGLAWRGLAASDIGWRPAPGKGTPPDEARARPRYVAFFAAEAQQRTPEAATAATPGLAAGLFTRAVIAALQRQPQTYAMWAASATQQYRSALQAYQLPRSAWPSPVYAGALDAPLWHGDDAAMPAPRWPVRRDAQGWLVPFGLLDGMRDGDLFQHADTRWRASKAGWGETRLTLLPGSADAAAGWATRTPAPLPAGSIRPGKQGERLAALLALPATPGPPLLDARIELTLPGKAPRQLAFADGDLGVLPAGTRIRLSVENRSAASVDLGLAHLPLDGPAARIYPALDGDSNRMPPAIGAGISRIERSFVVSGPHYGVEWLALVAAPAANGTLPRRFAIIEALPALPPTRGAASVAVPVAETGNPDQAQVARLSWRSVQ
ncbi:caspase family protein [Janthinobacterium sp. PAMC25594]|uniref:caspase family protein n=1 Tax=Janthinobacterium sp. PAMC25594 TaxID=2861284 RepID=UPI001C63024E|nr:caspase family protein [Janthinobacterium sp. PAMC25594]QYG06405.1 caspase family protein [Janthinobacterium sp. PAMC25594]